MRSAGSAVQRSRRSPRALLGLPAFVLAVSACTTVPTDSAVHAGAQAANAGVNQPNIQVPAASPVDGMSPRDIVAGFRLASQVLTNPAISHQYLVDRTWQPDGSVHVIDESGESVVPTVISGDSATVRVVDKLVGTIAADGTYKPAPATAQSDVTYTLTKASADAKGQWRITKPPSYLILNRAEVLNSYQRGYLYFVSPGGQFLVPIQVFLPRTTTAAASSAGALAELLSQLMQGPPGWLAKAHVTSALPQTTAVPAVRFVNGVVTVDLPPELANLNATERDQASAQIVATVHDAEPSAQVRITAGGQPLPNSHNAVVQTAKTWSSYDPDSAHVSGFYYLDTDGVPRNEIGVPILSSSSGAVPRLSALAIAPHLSSSTVDLAAGVAPVTGGQQLYVGPVTGFKSVLGGASFFTTPSWDLLGNLWTVQQLSTGSQQILVGVATATTLPKFQVVTIDGDLGNSVIVGLKVARGGSRVALITRSTTGSQVWVGHVEVNDNKEVIGGLYPVAPSLQPVADSVTWASSTTLDVLASSTGSDAPTAWTVDVDGWDAIPQQVPADTVSLAAAPGEPLVVATKTRQIEVLRSNTWQVLFTSGTSPNYPG